MSDVLTEIVPLGIAVAASPFPIVPAILLLFTPQAKASGLSFLGGWVLGILLSTSAFVALATVIERLDEPPAWASWARIGLGTALVVLGVRQWLTRHAKTGQPAWMQSIDEQDPAGALRLGLILSAANPKVLLLTAAAGLAIGAAGLGTSSAAAATLVFTVIAASTVAIPVLSYVVLGDRVLGPLGKARTWLQKHNAAVMAVVITAIGLVLVTKGLNGL